ncbi:MAG: OmpH family outer membrane protein [Candidatus Aminicenantes bacterium]|nr:MAG: OmpH family outer membrane protein [Candidatus Aminicenantes bacterium]
MRKTLILVIAVLVMSAFVFSEVKIGIVNAQEILQKTKKGIEIQKRLEQLQQRKQQKLQNMQEEVKKLEKDVLNPALNEEARGKKSLDLQNKRKELKRFLEDAQNEMQRESQKELVALEKDIMPVIDQIGKSKGFTVILDITRPGIVYFDQTIDITAEVIKAFDAKY